MDYVIQASLIKQFLLVEASTILEQCPIRYLHRKEFYRLIENLAMDPSLNSWIILEKVLYFIETKNI